MVAGAEPGLRQTGHDYTRRPMNFSLSVDQREIQALARDFAPAGGRTPRTLPTTPARAEARSVGLLPSSLIAGHVAGGEDPERSEHAQAHHPPPEPEAAEDGEEAAGGRRARGRLHWHRPPQGRS